MAFLYCRLRFFLGCFFPGMLRSFSRCFLLLHAFLFTNVNLVPGVCWQMLFLSAWIISTGLKVNWGGCYGFVFIDFLLSRHRSEKIKAFVLEEHNSVLVKSLVKLPLLCCEWFRRLMGSYYSLVLPQLRVCLWTLTEPHLSTKQSRTRARTWANQYSEMMPRGKHSPKAISLRHCSYGKQTWGEFKGGCI